MILVTGGNGFLGSHLLAELLRQGESIRVLRRTGSRMDILRRVLTASGMDPESAIRKIDWVEGDVLDIFSLEDAMEGVTEVYHCAAMVSFLRKNKKHMMKVNVAGTTNVVNAALRKNIRKLCHVSSIAALGRGGGDILIDEKSNWKTSPQNSNYAVSKYGGEREVWRGMEEGLPAVIVNPGIILGYGEENSGTARFFDTIRKGLLIYPGGMNGFVFVDDVVKAMIILMKSDVVNERFVLSAENLTYKKLLELIAALVHKRPPYIKAGKVLTAIAWRFEAIRSWMFKVKPLITRESAQTSMNTYTYGGGFITEKIGFSYTSVEEGLRISAGLFREDW